MDILEANDVWDVRVTHDNWLIEVLLTREIRALLAYLLLDRHGYIFEKF